MRNPFLFPVSAALGFLLAAGNVYSAELLTGRVESASGPLMKSKVILYRAGASTHEKASILAQTATADGGEFALSYQTQAADRLLYVVTRAGDHISSEVRLAAVLGMAGATPHRIVVNELTTISACWSMAQFFNNESIGGKTVSLRNAAAMGINIADVATGKIGHVLNTAPNGPKTETRQIFYSIANILSGSIDNDSNRQLFLSLTRVTGSTRPGNTLEALQSMARNPQNSVGGLFSLSKRADFFGPALNAKPTGWMIPLMFSSGGFTGPGAFAFDSEGSLWATLNFEDGTSNPAKSALKLLPNGAMAPGSPFKGGGIYGAAWGLMVDEKDRAWFGDFAPAPGTGGKGGVTLFTKHGIPLSPSKGFSEGGINRPQGIGRDSEGNVWIANFGNSTLTRYKNGNPDNNDIFSGGGLQKPFGLAIDDKDRVWTTNGPASSVSIFNSNGTPTSRSPVTGGGLRRLKGIALDSFGNAWVSNSLGKSVTMIQSNGKVHPDSPFKGGGVDSAWGICVDGDDNIWVAGFGNFSLAKLAGARASTRPKGKKLGDPISPSTGFTIEAMMRLTAVAVDASGNVWVANNWKRKFLSPVPAGSGIIVFVGMAAPVATPMQGLPKKP